MTEMSLDVSFDQNHRVPVTLFQLAGEIDAANYEQLQAQADEVFAAGTQYLLLDLTHVTYLSSSGAPVQTHPLPPMSNFGRVIQEMPG